ncbi:MAG: tRNA pseudouridine(55) synthase TruB [Waddliaceae bacterium]
MIEGILLVDKPRGNPSFSLITALRKKLNIKKIGHAGTLDPFATGVMVLLVGRNFTKKADKFLNDDKEYIARLKLGVATDSFDCDGETLFTSEVVPTLDQIQKELFHFQGEVQQIPPMFSAKKRNGKPLYLLARKGETVERDPVTVSMKVDVLNYEYPFLDLKVECSKGTYVRAIADDLGKKLECGAHLTQLKRTRSGIYALEQCIDGEKLFSPNISKEEIEANVIQ